MPELAVAPAAPAPSAPAASSPAPAAPATPAAGAPPVTTPTVQSPTPPAPVTTPAAQPAKYDPKTVAAPPSSSDYPDDAEGLSAFMHDNHTWGMEHPEEAQKLREARLAAEEGTEAAVAPEAVATVEAVKAAEGEKPAEPAKPADAVPEAATPAVIEEWTSQSPELKAAFEKSPELKSRIMTMAREHAEAKPILELVPTKESAQFAVDHANRLINVQSAYMLGVDDPEMADKAWEQTREMFIETDAQGKPILGADGQPKLAPDYDILVTRGALEKLTPLHNSLKEIADGIEQRLKGVYPSEEAREADAGALEQAKYNAAAINYTLQLLKHQSAGESELPELPPDATPQQKAFQEKLKAEQAKLDESKGVQRKEATKAARQAVTKEVDNEWSTHVDTNVKNHIQAMLDRKEYIPDYVLNDKFINPVTQKVTNLSDLAVRTWFELNRRLLADPERRMKLMQYELMGKAGKEQRLARLKDFTAKELPKIVNARVTEIQNGIRGAEKKKAEMDAAKPPLARIEPQSQGTVAPTGMSRDDIHKWAEVEAAKDPNWGAMSRADRAALTMSIASKKMFGG